MSRRLQPLLAYVLAFASFSALARASNDAPRVVMLEPPANLLDAMGAALTPWGLRVVPVASHPPGTTDVGAAAESVRAISIAHRAAVVLWLVLPSGGEPALWVYDAQTEQITVRPLPQGPPFDEAAAAAVALTVKTLLRSTTVAPLKERAAQEQGAAPSTSGPASTPAPPAPPADVSRGKTTMPAPSASGHLDSNLGAPVHVLRAEARLFAHLPTGGGLGATPRAGISAAYWPRMWNERVGLGVGLAAGPNQDVSGPAFSGSLSETVIDVGARGRLLGPSGWFSLELAVGPAVHVTSLTGAVLSTSRTSTTQRGDPALCASLVPELAIGGRLRLGVLLGTSILLRTQRYTVGQDLALKVPAVGFDLGGRASLALD